MVAQGEMAVKHEGLTPFEQRALQAFVDYLREHFAEKIKYVALFGSKARGDSREASDIDVLVILNREDRALRREIIRQAARLSLQYDVLLSPRVIGAERWEQMQGFSFYQNIQQEAAALV